MKLEHITSLSY